MEFSKNASTYSDALMSQLVVATPEDITGKFDCVLVIAKKYRHTMHLESLKFSYRQSRSLHPVHRSF